MSYRRFYTQAQLGRARLEKMKQYLLDRCVEEDGPLETKCLVYTGSCNPKGYGRVRYEGYMQGVHRLIWEASFGPIPEDLWVLHHCDCPPCCRISHLYLGTPADNTRDCWDRGRHPGNGGYPWNATPDEVVLEARQMAHEGHSLAFIAECLGISHSGVTRIVRGETRANVGGPVTIIEHRKSSRFVGVRAHSPGKWEARLTLNGRTLQLGLFGFEGDAAIAYNFHVAWLGLDRPLNPITEEDWHHD